MTDELRIERDGEVVRVTFDRPHRHNAFTAAMYESMRGLTAELAEDRSAQVVVFTGAGGRAFAAGNDIGDFAGRSTDDVLAYEADIRDLLLAIGALPQVTIAAVDGLCVGGGLAVASFCDLRLATASSRFGYPIARTLGNALPARLVGQTVRVFGDSVTRQMLLTSRLIDAARADEVGALLQVCEDRGRLDEAVEQLVADLALASRRTLRTTKAQLLDLGEPVIDHARDDERLAAVYGHADFTEGVRAFLAKERPRFDSP